MKTLFQVTVADDGQLSVVTDYQFPSPAQINTEWEGGLFERLTQDLREEKDQNVQAGIRLLEAARKAARFRASGPYPQIEAALADWRKQKALDLGVPAYYIMHQRVLLAIADAAPQTEEELLAVSGFGPVVFFRYGKEILSIIKQHK